MKSFRSILGSALVVLVVALLIIFRVSLVESFFSLSVGLKGMVDSSYSYGEFQSIRAINEGLKAEVSRLRDDVLRRSGDAVIEARIYSRFPSNTRNLLTVDRGAEAGVKENMSVFADAEQTLFLGRVSGITRFQSEIQTFFDAEWKSAVEIGDKKIKALLVGGTPPRIELLPKDSDVRTDDRVTNVAPEYPLGTYIGTVGDLEGEVDEIWRTAHLKPNISFDLVDRVFILTEFP